MIALIVAVEILAVGRGAAQAPSCAGDDAAAATRALAEGARAADRAAAALRRHRAEDAARAWTEALAAYDRACAAGSGEALERRAIPLFRLQRPVEAAESLDAYLEGYPLDEHEGELARRIATNLRAIERSLATVVVRTSPADAEISIGGRYRGRGPERRGRVLADTSVAIAVRGEGFEHFHEERTFTAGETHEVIVSLTPRSAPVAAEPVIVAAVPGPVLLPVAEPARTGPSHGLLIAGIVTGALGALSLVLGTLLVLESEGFGLALVGDPGDAGLVGASVLIGGSVVGAVGIGLLIANAVSGPREGTALRCAPGWASGSCRVRF